MNIVVCDDRSEFAEINAGTLRMVVSNDDTISVLTGDHLTTAARTLEARRRTSRVGGTEARRTPFDDVDVIVIDYDLLDASNEGFLTGEGLAYLIRCYSTAGVIIGMNQFDRKATFDLTLRDHPDSFADINISDKDLENGNLWNMAKGVEYRPWSWPVIPLLLKKYNQRLADLHGRLDETIWKFFEFPDDLTSMMSRENQAYVTSPDGDPRSTTFRQFVKESGHALDSKDEANEEGIERIAAARIGAWLARIVLPGQDILVDLPHLAERAPSSFSKDAMASIDANSGFEIPKEAELNAADQYRFSKDHWLPRPAWWWTLLEANDALPDIAAPWNAKSDRRFAEDTSAFEDIAKLTQFVSGLSSPYSRRFVKKLEHITYRPMVRLALE